ncbi:ATP-binding cassette subfamily F protein 3 [Roseiarcus fermentans]|uniref:ATP-binding cassette subfamily F protein 3 n=1 Tax=Roseiarcus fermentans TaxID=1473586 RepID=A0A366FGM3_9HYPH|nr:ABC-F family ATP-binding cassette domain-containing protein [Roseiarcus fermentans]RBP13824.1 ATP-binding cassette subfamily F protein 3 [Roseiarcus fermentans]
MLHINGLTYRLGARLLIDGATAALPSGARVGLVGRNGAGKSTLFRLIRGEISPESGAITTPRGARLGSVEQEAPGGPERLIDFVLSADVERAALSAEAEDATDPERIAEIQTRLVDIDAHAAPARAARILNGLGFDEAAQDRALSEYSGGWRMRVALAAVLFSEPDILLLDEPTNYLDLEGVLWLTDYLRSCPSTIVVISHDRDLLDDVADHILHLDRGRLTLWTGGYTSFERQRREQQALQGKMLKKQEERRAHLQAFVDRFRASATKATQAQSRLKMLAKMEPVTAVVDDAVLPFKWPPVARPLSPPIVTLEKVSAGYGERVVLSRLDLTLSNDDRIGLLGANGNGKSTFAKLIGGRLAPMAGKMVRANKLETGFFAQHQVDDLEPGGSPYTHVAQRMRGEPEAKIRGRAALIGFSGARADTRIEALSGGEKARLLMGLATFDGPQLLILDEPTNHLDIDSRAELIEAINDYEGACILVSHDRRLLEACVDRLWLVAGGTVKPFDGDVADYGRFVLGQSAPSAQKKQASSAAKPAPARKRDPAPMKRELAALEDKMNRFQDLLRRVDEALAQAAGAGGDAVKVADLAARRGDLERALAAAEEAWLELSEQVEGAS